MSSVKNKTHQSFKSLILGAWVATREERPRLYLFTFLFIAANSVDLLVPWALGYTLDVFVKVGLTDAGLNQCFKWIGIYLLLILLSKLCHHFARYVQNRVAYSARMNTLIQIFDSLMNFPLRWHVGHHSGENLSKLYRSTGAIDSLIGTYYWQMLECAVKVIFASTVIIALDYLVAINVVVLSSITIGIMILFNSKLISRFRMNNIYWNKINRICMDYLSNIVTVKTLNVERCALKHLIQQKNEGLNLSQAISAYMELKWGATSIGYALVVTSSLAIYFYSHKTNAEPVEIAQVYVLINYLDRIFQAIGSFTGYYSGMVEASTAYEDATDVFEQNEKNKSKNVITNLNPSWGKISMEKLNFSYVTGENVGLIDVNFEFKRGEKIALVGQSGSGKSTLLKVMGGLIAPDNYNLSTDLQNNISFDDLITDCLLIPQEPEIFSESVIYNLTMGDELDSKEISFFVALCKSDAIISKLPYGMESNLAQRGLNLSVGEKQRIALARGLLRAKQKEILLLDEPTSSLDPKTEKEIFLGLFYHFSSRTIISSCHRLNLIPLFDRVVMMANNRVLEVGTFAELIDARGHFYRVWEDYERNIKSNTQTTTNETVTPEIKA
ncbi:MAG: ABC transporter ATP-binding protein [Proteobacteria bacterium]|nr:ABC transporter ATP-binding protein [Pseudomonadota bacterium]